MPAGNEAELRFPQLFDPLFDHASLPLAKWPDQPELKAHYTKSIGDWWRQSIPMTTNVMFFQCCLISLLPLYTVDHGISP